MARGQVLLDTGPLVALFDARDPSHQVCRELLTELPVPLYTCWPVLTESMYLLKEWSTGGRDVFEPLFAGAIEILSLSKSDRSGIEAILKRFHDQKFQLADACLMHLCNREGISEVFTLDWRDFSVFRTEEGLPLTLLPSFD